MKIIPLSEGAFTIDQTKQFVPFNLKNDDLQERSKGSLLVEIQPFVVITSKDVILLDTGLGHKGEDGMMQIHKNLAVHNISPNDITKVLLSHLHKDHAAGISMTEPHSMQRVLSFPNAKYYVNRNELEDALKFESPSYVTQQFSILENSPNTVLLEGNGIIDDYIRYELTGAHSIHHQVFWIVENGQKIFFGADVAPQLMQMKSRFVAKYDYDGKKCMELRRDWWERGEKEKWTFLFYHDIKSPIFGF